MDTALPVQSDAGGFNVGALPGTCPGSAPVPVRHTPVQPAKPAAGTCRTACGGGEQRCWTMQKRRPCPCRRRCARARPQLPRLRRLVTVERTGCTTDTLNAADLALAVGLLRGVPKPGAWRKRLCERGRWAARCMRRAAWRRACRPHSRARCAPRHGATRSCTSASPRRRARPRSLPAATAPCRGCCTRCWRLWGSWGRRWRCARRAARGRGARAVDAGSATARSAARWCARARLRRRSADAARERRCDRVYAWFFSFRGVSGLDLQRAQPVMTLRARPAQRIGVPAGWPPRDRGRGSARAPCPPDTEPSSRSLWRMCRARRHSARGTTTLSCPASAARWPRRARRWPARLRRRPARRARGRARLRRPTARGPRARAGPRRPCRSGGARRRGSASAPPTASRRVRQGPAGLLEDVAQTQARCRETY